MNKKSLRQAAALCALALTFSLAGCASTPTTAASSEADSAASSASSEAADPNAAYSNFDASAGIDDKGYWEGVTATDCVTLPEDWEAMPIPSDISAVSDEDLQEAVDTVLEGYKTSDSVTDRAIVDGDSVNIDYVGTVDGVAFTGGDTKGNGTDVTAGGTGYIDDFLTQIIGHTPGETFDIVVTFPDGYADGKDADGNAVVLANKEAVFKTTINYITETNIPELTDEFVAEKLKDDYDTTTVQGFKDSISSNLQQNNEYAYIMDQLTSASTFADPLPQSVLDYEKASMLSYYANYASYYGTSLEDFVSTYMGVESVDAMVEQAQDSLTSGAKQYLALQAVAEKAGLTIDDAALDEYFKGEDYTDYADYYGKNYLRLIALSDKSAQYVLDHAVRGAAPTEAASEAAAQ